MNLIDKVSELEKDSYGKWFERWYLKKNLENEILRATGEGYKGFKISIKESYESEDNFNKDRRYLVRRLRDKRTVKRIEDKLGEGFKIEYISNTKKYRNILNMESERHSDWISIRWGNHNEE